MFYQIVLHSHSGLRWIVLLFLILTIVNSGIKYFRNKDFQNRDKRWSLITLNAVHLQLLLGLILYFISPKVIFSAAGMGNKISRFFLIEHSLLMLVAVVLITVGYSRSKKKRDAYSRHFQLFVFYGIALLIILIAIPWPWRLQSGGWF